MQALFEAMQDRFEADEELNLLGRKLYQGFENERAASVLPFCDVTFFGPGSEDTFGADVEDYTVRFSAFTKKILPAHAARQKAAIMRVFDDCDLSHGAFYVVQFRRETAHGPVLRDGVYQSTIDYHVILQRAGLVPAQRGV